MNEKVGLEGMPKNKCDKDAQRLLREVYHLMTCSNGHYSHPRMHEAVWNEINGLAERLFNGEIKC